MVSVSDRVRAVRQAHEENHEGGNHAGEDDGDLIFFALRLRRRYPADGGVNDDNESRLADNRSGERPVQNFGKHDGLARKW